MYVKQVACPSRTRFQLYSAHRLAKCPDRHVSYDITTIPRLYELLPVPHSIHIEMLKDYGYIGVLFLNPLKNVTVNLQ